jgi:hypothetical protein
MIDKSIANLITPSQLDNFIQYKTGYVFGYSDEPEEFTDEMLINSVLKLNPPSLKMQAGTAFHKILQGVGYRNLVSDAYICVGDWEIAIAHDLNINFEYPAIRECKVSGMIGGIQIAGTIDAMSVTQVHDAKLTFSALNSEKYMNSYQWRAYSLLTGIDEFIYDVFSAKMDELDKEVIIYDYNKIKCYAYPNMRRDVETLVEEFYHILCNIKANQPHLFLKGKSCETV